MSLPAADQDDLEEDEAIIKAEDARYRSTSTNEIVKEISAPYAVPHYPIELEEQIGRASCRERV